MFQSWIYLVLFIPIIYYSMRLLQVGRRPAGWPPGPPTMPVVGNILQMPAQDAYKQFQKWAKEYGPIYSLILGTKTWIILSSDVAVKDLMDKRSQIYSDRLDMYVGQALMSGGNRMGMMPYGSQWRMYRKMVHSSLNKASSRSYVPQQSLESKQMLYEMLIHPENALDHLQRYSSSLTTSFVYGWRYPAHDDPELKQLFDGFEKFVRLNQTPQALLLDAFPVLRLCPDWMVPVKKQAKHFRQLEERLYLQHWMKSKANTKLDSERNCFCADAVKIQVQEGFSDEQAAYIAGTLLEAGSDTTANTLYAFIQAMIVFPEVQKRAQAEIDRVCGGDKLPAMENEPQLPYIRACIKETLRWMPTAPTGAFPHAVTQDDSYMGYSIPKGAGVLLNTWTIHMDPIRYPSPREFDPSRFENDIQNSAESANNSDVSKRDHFGFGAGRRICQGMHVAEQSLFLGITRLLWAFDFSPKLDKDGQEITIVTEKFTQGFLIRPVDFSALIKSRSEARGAVVKREWEIAQTQLDGNGQFVSKS